MEVLEIEMEALSIGSTTFRRPVLVRSCPRDPAEIVLRSSGEIGRSGTACTGAGECIVLEKVSSVTSLPRSMKGYELYSWYVDREDAWYYTLATGTNREKSYAEISTPESMVTEDGWVVRITVRGTDALKSVLEPLPQDEVVTWNDTGQLVGAPAVDAAFPDRDVVWGITRLCRRRVIHLGVIE